MLGCFLCRVHAPNGSRTHGQVILFTCTLLLQVDGTCWVAFFAVCMLQMALELVDNTEYYDDLACEFLNHYCKIVCALMGEDGGDGTFLF